MYQFVNKSAANFQCLRFNVLTTQLDRVENRLNEILSSTTHV